MYKFLVSLVATHRLVAFLGITYGFSWSAWSLGYALQPTQVVMVSLIAVGAFGPAIAAAAVRRASGGSVRAWLATVLRWRVAARWYAAALLVPILIYGIGAGVLIAAGATIRFDRLGWGVLVFVSGLPVATLLTGGNEELGWRGFLLPRLQRRYGALLASLLVGIAWAGWHLPVYFLPIGLIEGSYVLFVPFIVSASVVFTWLYNSTEGNVLLAMLMHGSINSSSGLFLGLLILDSVDEAVLWGSRIVGAFVVVAVLLVFYDRTTLSSRHKHTANLDIDLSMAE